jgi:serine/threonine protein kinase/formylglycine-generating enzyme required for sulfatase activity
MDPATEVIWGRYALNSQKITRAQLQLCVEEQGRLREKGMEKTLSQLMLEHDFIDEKTAKQLIHLEGMIPGYYMKEILGSGGLGIVYKAFSEKLGKDVAIKILNPENTDNALVLNRFLREIEIGKKLDHANIVKGLDSGRADDLYYLAMEYVNGDNLATYAHKFGCMKEEDALSVAVVITNALCYAWGKGLTHRDIKPENIILTPNGSLKICDFGLAKLADANVTITMSGTIVGSPYYISPEQVTGAMHLDYRSDIYSLGATLYFITTGKLLFDEKTIIGFCNAHINKEPLPPSRHVAVTTAFDELIMRMLNKDPQKRCSSPEEFVHYLRSLIKIAHPRKTIPSPIRLPQNSTSLETAILPSHGATRQQEIASSFDEETFEDSFQQPSVLPQSKKPMKFFHKAELRSAPVAISLPVEKKVPTPPTTPVALRHERPLTHAPKTKIADVILQHLLLSFSFMDMDQFSACMATQVEYQLHGQCKSLSDIIVARGYVRAADMQNLKLFRDKDGNSLIPGYEIVNMLAEKEQALLFLARHASSNTTVALKVFAPSISSASDNIVRFMREAEAAKRLNHPNIVKAIDFGSIHGIYYLAMEHVAGLSLSQIVAKVGRMEETRALEILYQITEALTYAWKQNIVHRNITPDNILSNGEVFKICDLGLAKALESPLQLTEEWRVMGTPQYMSPEQFQPERQLDFRTDVYSLGVTFFLMLTGQLPFLSGTKYALAQEHLTQRPPRLEKFGARVSQGTRLLLRKMLAKDPERRCQGKDEILEDIWRVQQGQYPQNSKKNFFRYITRPLLATALVAVCLLVGWLAMFWWRHTEFLPHKNLPVNKPMVSYIQIRDIWPQNGAHLTQEKIALKALIECGKLEQVQLNGKILPFHASSENLWAFTSDLILKPGLNQLKFAITVSGQQTVYEHVLWRDIADTTAPVITLSEPSGILAGQRYTCNKQHLTVKGEIVDDQKVETVWVNKERIPVMVQEKLTSFATTVTLTEGEQMLAILAKDTSGNEVKYEFIVYLPSRGWYGEILSKGLPKSAKAGEYLCANDGAVMVYVPAGEFWLGTEKNARQMHLPAFYIDKFEVTWQQYEKFCKETGHPMPQYPTWGVKPSHPVAYVSLEYTMSYAKWCGKRLPTVAEWSKAARGGLKVPDWQRRQLVVPLNDNPLPLRIYPWGNELPNAMGLNGKVYRCNYCADDSFIGQGSDGYMYTARVGDFSPWDSPYGCCDMAGNVAEICSDWPTPEQMGKVLPGAEKLMELGQVKMGGGFYSLSSHCTIVHREKFSAGRSESQTGFRLIKEVDE